MLVCSHSMSTKTIYYIAFSLVSITMYGQNMFITTGAEDLVALDYNIYTSLNDVQFEKKSITVDFTSLLKKPTFGFGVHYTNTSSDFEDYDMYNHFNSFEELHSLEIYAKYKKALANNWDLDITLAPYLSSTFNEKITSEDFVFSYAANFIKTWHKDNGLESYLKLGAGYGSLFGKPNFYPLISYSNNVNEKFRYEIGFPITGAYYAVNEQSIISLTGKPESIYANNASGFSMENDAVFYNSKYEFTALNVALGYNFQFDSNWSTYFNVGYLTASELSITKNDNVIYDFDSDDSLSLNIGISLNINNK